MSLGPEVLAVRSTPSGITIEIVLRSEHRLLQGHFPAVAIFPGVGQIHWAIEAARQHLDMRESHVSLHQLKFTRLIRPQVPVQLDLQRAPTSNLVFFRLLQSERECASGQIRFANA